MLNHRRKNLEDNLEDKSKVDKYDIIIYRMITPEGDRLALFIDVVPPIYVESSKSYLWITIIEEKIKAI